MNDLQREIQDLLERAQRGKLNHRVRGHLTAYQVLERLPPATRSGLIDQYGPPGKDSGRPFTAASAVARALAGMHDLVDVDYLGTRDLGLSVEDVEIEAGHPLCGLYRLKKYGPSTW